jgi:hypothetical protein
MLYVEFHVVRMHTKFYRSYLHHVQDRIDLVWSISLTPWSKSLKKLTVTKLVI